MQAAFYFLFLGDLKTVQAGFFEAENRAAGRFFFTFIANKNNSAGGLATVRAVPENPFINFIWPYTFFLIV